MKIKGKDYDIIWEKRRRDQNEAPAWSSAPEFGDYIGFVDKAGRIQDETMLYDLYALEGEIEAVGLWLKMNQLGPRTIYEDTFDMVLKYEDLPFTEPDLELRREIVSDTDVRLTFIFDIRDDDPKTISFVVAESELARAADEWVQEHER